VASLSFILSAVAFAAVPLAANPTLACTALALGGACNGYGNLLTITAFQQWALPAVLGRLMGVVMTFSMGVFPVSVWLGGVVVHTWGAAAVFWLGSAILMLAIFGALTQREWRDFGQPEHPDENTVTAADVTIAVYRPSL
jgi:predicted MFS family arabinose efflux permease